MGTLSGRLTTDDKIDLGQVYLCSEDLLEIGTQIHPGGKSLIFQCIPVLIDALRDQAYGTSTVLVISPLKALMLDQVNKLKGSAVSAAAIYKGQTQSTLDLIIDGEICLVYALPEQLLDANVWRNILSSESFRARCEVVVVDEAHCIAHW